MNQPVNLSVISRFRISLVWQLIENTHENKTNQVRITLISIKNSFCYDQNGEPIIAYLPYYVTSPEHLTAINFSH
jgi:hypothetical protein